MNNSSHSKRGSFGSTFGMIAAAAGSAIGLGNVWKFPYEAGENGGSAFLLIYFAILFVIGIPLMISEFVVGRSSHSNPVDALKKASKNKYGGIIGILGVIAAFLILAFYSTVAGWTMHYTYLASTNAFSTMSATDLRVAFDTFTQSGTMPVVWQTMFMILTIVIVLLGIEKGIERYTKFLMPLLFVLLIVLCVRSITLENASKGLAFLFIPNFNAINSDVLLNALGQVFFSLSLGMGTMITYASYFSDKENLSKTAIYVSLLDTIIAVLAGIAIFPAVFALGFSPAEGPGLVFIVLPQVFNSLPAGQIFALIFFLLLTIAAITSSISLLEVVVAYVVEEHNISRTKASIIGGTLSLMLGIFATLSFAKIEGLFNGNAGFFNLLENLSTNILLPVGGLLIVLIVGWVMDKKIIKHQLGVKNLQNQMLYKGFRIVIRYIAPLAIILVFLNAIGII